MPSPPAERIVAAVAGHAIGEGIAGAGEIAHPGEDQVLDAGGESGADRCLDRIDAGGVDDGIVDIVDHVGVVAGAAIEPVGAGAAIERVVAGACRDGVDGGVAGCGDIAGAAKRQAFDVADCGQRVGCEARADFVVATERDLDNGVAGTGKEDIVAEAADERIRAAAAVEGVVAVAAVEHVVAAPAEHYVIALVGGDAVAAFGAGDGVVAGRDLGDEER